MDISQLKYFISVESHLSFSKAAEDCHVVQATVSRQIAKLEEELGVALFERDSHDVKLTSAGRMLADYAPVFVEYHNNIVARIRNVSQGFNQTIRIGIGPYEHLLIREPLKLFHNLSPLSTIDFSTYTYYVLMTRYRNNVLDLSICIDRSAFEMSNFVSEPIYSEQWEVVASADNPFWRLPHDQQKVLYRQSVITLINDMYEPVRRYCESSNYQHCGFFETNFLVTLLEMVQSGIGIALLPPFIRPMLPADVHMKDILEVPFSPSFHIAYNESGFTPAKQLFIELCKKCWNK